MSRDPALLLQISNIRDPQAEPLLPCTSFLRFTGLPAESGGGGGGGGKRNCLVWLARNCQQSELFHSMGLMKRLTVDEFLQSLFSATNVVEYSRTTINGQLV